MTTKVKRGQNEGNRKREQSHWGKTESINIQITSGLNGTENMSIWTWYKWLMTWKFATSAGKNTGGAWWPPADEKPFEAVQAACVVSSGRRSCQSPWGSRSCCCCWLFVQENVNHFHSTTFPVHWKLAGFFFYLPSYQLSSLTSSSRELVPSDSQWLIMAAWMRDGLCEPKLRSGLVCLNSYLFKKRCRDVALCTYPG